MIVVQKLANQPSHGGDNTVKPNLIEIPSDQENLIVKQPSPPTTSVTHRAALTSLISFPDIILPACHYSCFSDSEDFGSWKPLKLDTAMLTPLSLMSFVSNEL